MAALIYALAVLVVGFATGAVLNWLDARDAAREAQRRADRYAPTNPQYYRSEPRGEGGRDRRGSGSCTPPSPRHHAHHWDGAA